MRGAAASLRLELLGLSGIVERNAYIIKRYIWWELAFFVWTLANTLTIVYIPQGFAAAGQKIDVATMTTTVLIGALVWSYLGMVFELLIEMVQWERWEGTIEYTFMAPLSRSMHLVGTGLFAVVYGIVRTAILWVVVSTLFFHLHLDNANYGAALVVLAIASVSFIGIGMMTSVLPLISPEKGVQLGFIAQGVLLVVSGVYYPVTVLPDWMRWLSVISPATYALRALRHAILNGTPISDMWGDIWPLFVIGVIAIPLGLWIFRTGERYAKRHGKLKRSG
jgi:ABC-2 type transport system permease protein